MATPIPVAPTSTLAKAAVAMLIRLPEIGKVPRRAVALLSTSVAAEILTPIV